MDLTLAFVVPDDEREHFAEWSDISRRQDLVLGIGPDAYYRARVESLLPDAEIVALDSPRVFFRGDPERVHALVMAAENGSAWTLVYPSFSVAVPLPERIAVPVGYAMPRGATSLHAYVDAFVNLKVKDGTTQRLFAHWFEGRTSERKRPRWSVARDVLGWFE